MGQYDSGLALWGNRQLLQRTDDAWSLAEPEDILKKLKSSGVALPLDMKFNYGMGEWFSYGFAPIVQGFGGDRSFAQAVSDVAKGADPQRALDDAAGKIDRYIAGASAKKAP